MLILLYQHLFENMYIEVFLVIFIGLLIYYIINHSNNKYFQNIRGPKGVFLLGNVSEGIIPLTDILPKLMEYDKMFGGIFKLSYGPFKKYIFVADYKLIEHVLSSNKFVEKSHHYKYFLNWLGKGLFTSSGVIHKKHKQLITPSFHFSMLVQFIEKFESVSDVLVDKLMAEVGKASVDIYPTMALFALDVISETALGTSISVQQDEGSQYIDCVKIQLDIMFQRILSPLHKWFYPLTPNYYIEKRTLNKLNYHTDSIIDRRYENLTEEIIPADGLTPKRKLTILDSLLTSSEQFNDGKPISREGIRQVVNTITFGGFDTVASTLSFILYALATHPDVQQKAVREQKEIFGDNKNSKITLSDLQKMKYLECIIKETLRLYPAAAAFMRNVSEDFEWDGSLIPKNTTIIILPYVIHRNPEYFQKPEEFIPERFENYTGKYPYSYIPFSAGPRSCIGQKFAMLELKTALSKILRSFILSTSTPEHVLKLIPKIVLVSQNGVRISLQKREEM